MSDSSDIDNALLAMLGADTTLLSYMPHGVHWEWAPPGSTKYVLVRLVDSFDEPEFGGRAYEDLLYQVTAVANSKFGGNLQAAAARIDALLEDQPIGIGSPPTVAGYTWMTCYRESRVRTKEPDGDDASIEWQQRGGRYRVQMSLTATGSP